MQPTGYSPYHGEKDTRRKSPFKLPKLGGGFKKWLLIILGILFSLFLIIYICLGDLRFFANNFLRLSFFQKDYLIVLQNNYEARPAGGFVTAYGEVSVTLGNPSNISFHNSYEIDTESYVTPPYPHEEMLKNEWYEGYTFRDANWNPNFPETAQTLIEFYNKKFPDKDVDGIIVVNYNMVENLVNKLGGINIDGQEIMGNQLFKSITDAVNDVDRHDETALMDRKDILGELASSLIPKAKWHPFKTKKTIVEALENKDMFMWFKSPALQRKISKKNWGNIMEPKENSDFLAVNLANLGSKKADRYLVKEVYHHVNIQKELPEVTTEVVIRYPGSKNNYADDYKGYLRVYIPADASVKSDVLGAKEANEGNFKVISTEIILPAGGKTSVSYTYQLPRSLLNSSEYKLHLVKQSGDNKRYTITAESYQDSDISSEDFTTKENRAYWEGVPQGDLDISLSLLPDQSAPYPIEQVFSNLSTISVYWNESIDTTSGSDALNYQIIDANHTNKDVTDEIKVVYAEVINESTSRLEIEGITDQNLERYKITLKNIQDRSGNNIEPNPKEITVVQRIEEVTTSEENEQ